MNELTPELQEKIHAVWDKKVLTPVEASRRVNELLGNPPLDPAEALATAAGETQHHPVNHEGFAGSSSPPPRPRPTD